MIQSLVKEFFDGKEPAKAPGVEPDEAVVRGAAIQAGNVAEWHDCGCPHLEVSSLAFGVETVGGIFTKVVPRGAV